MIIRKDLVKDFEIVVKQEIINHNNSILQTNLEINSLKEAIHDLKTAQEKKIAALESKNISLEHDLEGLQTDLEGFALKTGSSFNDLLQETEKSFTKLANEFDKLSTSSVPRDIYKENIYELRKSILEIKNEFSLFDKAVELKSDHQYSKFNERLEKHKKEIALEPTELKEAKRELNSRINANNVDISGIYEELQIQKKKQFVLEKECERLKTHLERIKKEK